MWGPKQEGHCNSILAWAARCSIWADARARMMLNRAKLSLQAQRSQPLAKSHLELTVMSSMAADMHSCYPAGLTADKNAWAVQLVSGSHLSCVDSTLDVALRASQDAVEHLLHSIGPILVVDVKFLQVLPRSQSPARASTCFQA